MTRSRSLIPAACTENSFHNMQSVHTRDARPECGSIPGIPAILRAQMTDEYICNTESCRENRYGKKTDPTPPQ